MERKTVVCLIVYRFCSKAHTSACNLKHYLKKTNSPGGARGGDPPPFPPAPRKKITLHKTPFFYPLFSEGWDGGLMDGKKIPEI